MNKIWTGLVILLLLSCSGKKQEDVSTVTDSTLTAADDTLPYDICVYIDVNFSVLPNDTVIDFPGHLEFNQIIEKQDSLAKQCAELSMVDSVLVLTVRNGQTVKFTNNIRTDGDDYTAYYFVKDEPAINHWVMLGLYYESYSFFLVNKDNGKVTNILGQPILSPDKKYFVCGNVDLQAAFTTNGLELWSANQGEPSLVWSTDIESWGTDKMIWKSTDVITGLQTYLNDKDESGTSTRLINLHVVGLDK